MKPEVWGPHMWFMLHTISFNYPEQPSEHNKRAYYDFFRALADVLPCDECQTHYKRQLHSYPIQPHLDSRSNLVKWVIQMHNFVNGRTGKPELTNEEVLTIYKNLKPVSPFYKVELEPILEQRKYKTHYRVITMIIIVLSILLWSKWYYRRHYFD